MLLAVEGVWGEALLGTLFIYYLSFVIYFCGRVMHWCRVRVRVTVRASVVRHWCTRSTRGDSDIVSNERPPEAWVGGALCCDRVRVGVRGRVRIHTAHAMQPTLLWTLTRRHLRGEYCCGHCRGHCVTVVEVRSLVVRLWLRSWLRVG